MPECQLSLIELEGNSSTASAAAFSKQLRTRHGGPLTVILDNASPPFLLSFHSAKPLVRFGFTNLRRWVLSYAISLMESPQQFLTRGCIEYLGQK